MRILMLAPWRAAIIKRLIAALEKEGIEIILASHDAAGQDGVIDLGPLNSFWDYFRAGKVKKLIDEFKPDLIHAHYATHYGVMAAMQRKVPFVQALWGNDVLYYPLNFGRGRVAFLKLLLRFVVSRATICHSSSQQVCDEAKTISGVTETSKFQAWFWGVIPDSLFQKPQPEDITEFTKEYDIPTKIILSGRGLANIYRPKEIAEIIKQCAQLVKQKKSRFVILRGTATNQDVANFKQHLIEFEDAYVLVNRILNEKELAHLYHSSMVHLSIPLSDSLGGGVVEPAICGSYPILSNLPGNCWFAKKYTGFILLNDNSQLANQAAEEIHKVLLNEVDRDLTAFQSVIKDLNSHAVVTKMISLYREAINANN